MKDEKALTKCILLLTAPSFFWPIRNIFLQTVYNVSISFYNQPFELICTFSKNIDWQHWQNKESSACLFQPLFCETSESTFLKTSAWGRGRDPGPLCPLTQLFTVETHFTAGKLSSPTEFQHHQGTPPLPPGSTSNTSETFVKLQVVCYVTLACYPCPKTLPVPHNSVGRKKGSHLWFMKGHRIVLSSEGFF
jgi:hypothetical protein